MNPLVAHLVSGQILFTGLPLMILLIWGYERITRPELRRLTLALVWICGVFTLSTTAVPWWAIALLIASLGCWSARSWLAARQLPGWVILALPIGISVLLVAAEIPWTMCPTVALGDDRSIVVWGDSLSAGLGEGEGTPWPLQLRDAHRLNVHNLSEAGATTQDALRQIKSTDHFPGLVIVELGGNDLLGGRSCEAFAHDLDGILAYLHDHQRTVVMLELPVLPGKNAWGVVQRRLARKYDCQLVPKRLLVDVLASPGATVDTLHLTQLGHQRLAEMVWRVVGPGPLRSAGSFRHGEIENSSCLSNACPLRVQDRQARHVSAQHGSFGWAGFSFSLSLLQLWGWPDETSKRGALLGFPVEADVSVNLPRPTTASRVLVGGVRLVARRLFSPAASDLK